MYKKILASLFAIGLVLVIGTDALGMKLPNDTYLRSIEFYNTHTKETRIITYKAGTRYTVSGMKFVSHIMRDHRANKNTDIKPELVDVLFELKAQLEVKYPEQDIVFNIISGYRSPETNAMLRKTRGGQAKKSRHMHGDAIDIRIPGIDTTEIRDTVWCMQRGGVGYYKGSDFVHIDTHKVRYWNWKPTQKTCSQHNS